MLQAPPPRNTGLPGPSIGADELQDHRVDREDTALINLDTKFMLNSSGFYFMPTYNIRR